MKRILFLTTMGVLPLFATPGLAACVSVLPNITCTGVAAGFTNTTNGLNVTVEAGATVSRTTADAFRLQGTGVTVTNDGTITGGSPGQNFDGIDGGTNLTVKNTGTITGTNRGIDANNLNGLTVENSGTITGGDRGIRNGDGSGARITNSGRIESANDEGVETGNDAVVKNLAGGIIRGSDDALQVGENALIENWGLIESLLRGGDEADPQDAIDIDSGIINNYASGIIRSDDDAAIDFDPSVNASTITNWGLISGTLGVTVDGLDGGAQTINNHGTIEGRTGTALDLGAGDDLVNLYIGSTLDGDVDMGADDDRLTVFGDAVQAILGDAALAGGEGFDILRFADLKPWDLLRATFTGDAAEFVFESDPAYVLRLTGWERFGFGDRELTAAQVTAAIPLPATGLLLIPALAALFRLRRRRR